jgi:uncharacterized membrane protein
MDFGAQRRPRQRLILALLALNLFLGGIVGAFLIGYDIEAPSPHGKWNPARRIEQLAARLSRDDAQILLLEFTHNLPAIEQASEVFRQSREKVRLALRAEPYDVDATRRAMTEAAEAHQNVDRLLQDVIAFAAAKMTAQGRRTLADRHSPASPPPNPSRRFPPFLWLYTHPHKFEP